MNVPSAQEWKDRLAERAVTYAVAWRRLGIGAQADTEENSRALHLARNRLLEWAREPHER